MAWYALQVVVAFGTFVWIGQTFGLEDRGLAPAFVSMTIAWMVTEAFSKVIGWTRSLRSVAVGDKLQRCGLKSRRALPHLSDGPKLVGSTRISQDRRELPKIAP